MAYAMKTAGLFNVELPAEAVTDAATIDQFNPLATIVTAVPSNIIESMSSNNSILAVVVVAIVIGLCMNVLGEKTDPLKHVLEAGSEVINFYLTFLINKVGPVAIFCLVSRTFAIYGAEYLAPAAAYIVGAMITLFILVVTIYPIGIWLTTRLNPFKFLKKIAKVGVFGFSTNSSAATLPLNTKTNLEELGCSQRDHQLRASHRYDHQHERYHSHAHVRSDLHRHKRGHRRDTGQPGRCGIPLHLRGYGLPGYPDRRNDPDRDHPLRYGLDLRSVHDRLRPCRSYQPSC